MIYALITTLEPLASVNAMWEGGSKAWGHYDEYSDIDLQLDVQDGDVEDVFALIDSTLAGLSPIAFKYRIPEPAWHGMSQCFYRLSDASEFHLLDLAIRKASDRGRFDERELHGEPVVHFDKLGVVTVSSLDQAAHREAVAKRVADLRQLFGLFKGFVQKEVLRDNQLGALQFYHSMVLRPLNEMARIAYCPDRYNFSWHYNAFDLPAELNGRLEQICYVATMEELAEKQHKAEELFMELLAKVEPLYLQ